jgi:membrane protein implicated in regulation of membrane protease activity
MSWWLWVLLGLALLAIELATPGGLFALFFGIGALAVAPLAAAGVDAVWQWLAFSGLSVALLAALRRWLLERLVPPPRPAVDGIVGEEALLLVDVPAGGEGKAELRGVPWSARAVDGAPLRAGQRARVDRIDGLTLYLRAG